MEFIDLKSWPRREIYEFFSGVSQPFYFLSFETDVTALRRYTRREGLSFYYAMVWVLTRAVNSVPAFLLALRDGRLVRLDRRCPSFTDLKPDTECFHIVTLDIGDSLTDYCRMARAQSMAQSCFIDASKESDGLIYLSCLPWLELTCITNERDFDPDDSVPRISWGKYRERDGRTLLNLSLEVNHRFIDGVHAGQLAQAIARELAALSPETKK